MQTSERLIRIIRTKILQNLTNLTRSTRGKHRDTMHCRCRQASPFQLASRQNKNSGVAGRPPHYRRFTPVHVRLPLNTGDETMAKERRNQIRSREGNILQMPAQRENKSCAASCLNVFFVTHPHPPRATPSPRRAGGGAQGRLSSQQ